MRSKWLPERKGDQFSTAGGGKTAGISLQNSEIA